LQFFRKTRIVIPVPAKVSPAPFGAIVTRFLAGLVKLTVQYDESGQTMSAIAGPTKLVAISATSVTTSDFLNICDTSKRTFCESIETEVEPEVVAFQEPQHLPSGFAQVET
jgi:hypothetical protein